MRILIYDETDDNPVGISWDIGHILYEWGGYFDEVIPAYTWREALEGLVKLGRKEKIREVQYWGHGTPGVLKIADEKLMAQHFRSNGWAYPLLKVIRQRMRRRALVWFRTCSTFGGATGKHFAEMAAEAFGCRVAGFTHKIGIRQSGLHSLKPGKDAKWPDLEGFKGKKKKPRGSYKKAPNTIWFYENTIPPGW